MEHIELSLKQKKEENLFSNIKLKYVSLPDIDIEDIDISTSFSGIHFKYPIYFNAITGGTKEADILNKRLEYISRKLDIFMFSGSYSPNLLENKYYYPKGMGANIGIDKSIDDMIKTVKETEAKILQIHLNIIQEMIMNEININVKQWNNNLENAISTIKIPIILKETGFGISKEMIEKAIRLGIKTIDISGRGGTNFAIIEDNRKDNSNPFLYNLGYTTEESLEIVKKYKDKIEILASGGIRTPLDVVKCLSNGAKSVGISVYILELLIKYDDEEIIKILTKFIEDIKKIILLTNSRNIEELQKG